MLLSQEKLKKPKSFLNKKVAVFTRNRTNKQLWQKVTIPFLIAKIQHFVSITNINNESQIHWCYGLMKNIFQELFQTWNPFHNVMALWSHHSIIFPFTQSKRERKLLMSFKANRNLNKPDLSFLINKTTKRKVTAKTTFRIILLFRQQK